MMKKCVFGIFLAALFSCNKSEQFSKIQSAATSEVLRNTAGILKLETFDFPNDIEGCSCYFSKNKEGFDSEKYIYADDYGKKAVIKIDGKFISFPLKQEDFEPTDFRKSFSNGEYEIFLKGKKISGVDETTMIEGELSVKDKNGKTATSKFYGECGC